jgi:TRAP-type C4-dicarboxylate transport system permease small subunit
VSEPAEVSPPAAEPRPAGWLDRCLYAVIAVVLFAMMALTAVDVVGRYLLGAPVPGSYEISQFLLAFLIFAALPVVTRDGSHITVSLFESAFSSVAKRLQRLFVLATSAVALAAMSWQLWSLAGRLDRGNAATGYLEWRIAPVAYAMCALSVVALLVIGGLLWREAHGRATGARRAAPDA